MVQDLVHFLVDDLTRLDVLVPPVAIQAVPGADRTGLLGMHHLRTLVEIDAHGFSCSSPVIAEKVGARSPHRPAWGPQTSESPCTARPPYWARTAFSEEKASPPAWVAG